MLPAAAAAQPFALDQARRYIQRLLNIINERNAQLELLKTHLEQNTELCNVHQARADRAEANATAARDQLLRQQQPAAPAPASPGLSPADLAALNALPPAERDAMWLRRVFVRGDHNGTGAPLGPFELAGLYLDAFVWSGTAASENTIITAVARVFPGVALVPTECGPRFRGLVRAQAAPAGPQEAQARQLRTERSAAPPDPYASAADASSSSRPASPPLSLPAKRKRSPEPEPEPEPEPDHVPEAPTSKRVRTAQGGAVKAEDALDLRAGVRVLHDVATSALRVRAQDAARIPPVEKPARVVSSVATQTINVWKTFAETAVQVCDARPQVRPQPTFSLGTQTIGAYKTCAETGVRACDTCPARTYAEAGVQACDARRPQIEERSTHRDALLADPAKRPPDLPPLRVPREIVRSALPDRAVRIVSHLRRGDEDSDALETFLVSFADFTFEDNRSK